jgi:hypothetical protein
MYLREMLTIQRQHPAAAPAAAQESLACLQLQPNAVNALSLITHSLRHIIQQQQVLLLQSCLPACWLSD